MKTAKVVSKKEVGLRPSWKPGESGNPEGRPKNIVNIAKKIGYSASDIRLVMAYCLTTTSDQRDTILGNTPDALTELILKSLNSAIKTGNFSKAKDIIDHVAGKAMQTNVIGVEAREGNAPIASSRDLVIALGLADENE